MKKANLYIWLIALLIYPAVSLAQSNDCSLYFYNSQKQSKFEQRTNYLITPFHKWQMLVNGKTSEDKRLDFNQTSRNSNLSISFYNDSTILNHSFQTGYEYLYDHSNLESELKPYRNRTGFLGYGLSLNPVDSLSLSTNLKTFYRQEQDRYRENHKFISQGWLEKINSRYLLGNETKSLLVSGGFENKQIDWEKYYQYSASLSGNFQTEAFSLSSFTNASSRKENLYVLESPDSSNVNSYYSQYDKQFKKNLDTTVNLDIALGGRLNCQLSEQYSLHQYDYSVNKTRSSGDYNNLAQIKFDYQLTDNIKLQSNGSHNYYIKDLSFVNNTRVIDIRYINNSMVWEYNPYDSLMADYTMELRRTDYPDAETRLDNDYLSKILNLGWTVYWKDRIRISNHVLYSTKDEVFLDALLSANNNTVTGLQWQPECDILLGDSFLFQQDYQIRADYDNYYYNNFNDIQDTFYRRLYYSYHLIYDSTPIVAKLTSPKWILLPFRSRNPEAVRFDANYSWERNETSAKDGNVYIINGVNERRILSLLFQKQYGIGIYQVMPKYSWGEWKEYSLLMSSIWQLNRNSFAEINLNPLGESLKSLDWRISCSINLLF